MSIVEKLTENIVDRNLQKEGAALLNKWEATGLLEGLDGDREKDSMSRLLENQAKELLREASTMAGADVEGFASVAFPIVRRVFGGLLANELVSVQPMSLPSGLIFFMDFQKANTRLGDEELDSVYGGGKIAKGIQSGVDLTKENAEEGFYSLNNGYASPTGSATVDMDGKLVASGTVGGSWLGTGEATTSYNSLGDKLVRFDPDLSGSTVAVASFPKSSLGQLNDKNLVAIQLNGLAAGTHQARRLSVTDPVTPANVLVIVSGSSATAASSSIEAVTKITFPIEDNLDPAAALGGVVGADLWGMENANNVASGTKDVIPEIDIKVDSVAVTAITKKLKAKWSPELGQDLNAYHNLDAEVELTSILSEQIALEIDREILEDLIKGATGATLYWSRRPGKFVNRETGSDTSSAGDFTGTVSEWYETLLETVNDASARIHRKVIRGGANFLVCGPEVASILEMTAGFRASVAVDASGQAGAVKVGSVNKKWDVHVDPYFPRNVILVGRNGSSFLESGYVYAPYVPLQVTPTIFGVEDFVPRKGVMTRYGKKMVRPDMYAVIVVQDLLG